MKFRKLLTGDESELLELLSAYPETTMFISGNLKSKGLEGQGPFSGTYYGAFDADDSISGVIVRYWSGMLMLRAISTEVVGYLVNNISRTDFSDISGAAGDEEQTVVALNALGIKDEMCNLNSCDGLYALDLADLITQHTEGESACGADQISEDILKGWLSAYNVEALGSRAEDDVTEEIDLRVKVIRKSKMSRILLKGGVPVSLCGINARVDDMVQIGPVWTPPEHRSNGYSRRLVSASLEALRGEGVTRAVLFTDNPAAAKAYMSVGFNECGKYRLTILREPLLFF